MQWSIGFGRRGAARCAPTGNCIINAEINKYNFPCFFPLFNVIVVSLFNIVNELPGENGGLEWAEWTKDCTPALK